MSLLADETFSNNAGKLFGLLAATAAENLAPVKAIDNLLAQLFFGDLAGGNPR
jgi:hypothetical protein